MRNEQKWGLALIMITALWGWSFVAIHESMAIMSAASFNAWRFGIGAVMILPIAWKAIFRMNRQDICTSIWAGTILFLAFAFQTAGIAYTSASNASFITGLAVVFTPIIAFIGLKKKTHRRNWICGFIALIGLAMLSIKGFVINIGDLLVLACAMFTAIHITILSGMRNELDAVSAACIQLIVVALFSTAWAFVTDGFVALAKGSTLTDLAVIGIFGTAIAYWIQTKAQRFITPTKIALILILEPAFGGLFGYLLAGDKLSALNWAGAVIILFSIFYSEIPIFLRPPIKSQTKGAPSTSKTP